ncbi:MAG: hypothetical protein AMXMBFR64_21230 [Myxococcales bacterium]
MGELLVGHATDTGKKRDRNEDAYRVFHGEKRVRDARRGAIFAVADGMGGHKAGAQASRMTVDQLWLYFQYPPERFHGERTLLDLVRSANNAVWTAAQEKGSHHRMGCTLSVLHVDEAQRQATVVHVGDSRIYCHRRGQGLRQVTVDHVEPENVNQLANHIGHRQDIYVETSTWLLNRGDRWLLCTDGLTKGVTKAELAQVLDAVVDPQAACQRLIELANRTGEDNVTVVIVDVA